MKQTTLWVTGINHDTAPVAVRERFALSGEALDAALQAIRHEASEVVEAVIISTCNRLELYALLPRGRRPEELLAGLFSESASDLQGYTYSHRGDDAIAHLFRVV